jgi:hypothetical protein
MKRDRILLGHVSCHSGKILIIDMGLLKLWNNDSAPIINDGCASPNTVEAARTAKDFRIVGRDSIAAGKEFNRQYDPRFLYDIPGKFADKFSADFEEFAKSNHFDARLESVSPRITHRRRIDLALEHGKGIGVVQYNGLWAIACDGLPDDRRMDVYGVRMPDPEWENYWEFVELSTNPEQTAVREMVIGSVMVDEARLMFVDVDALKSWQHEEPLDGMADFVFWGKDAAHAAQTFQAPCIDGDSFGWMDLEIVECAKRGTAIEKLRDSKKLKLATDFRPHSHHYFVMKEIRASETQSATFHLSDTELCAFMTTWGDGLFDVSCQFDRDDRMSSIRIQLGNEKRKELIRSLTARR